MGSLELPGGILKIRTIMRSALAGLCAFAIIGGTIAGVTVPAVAATTQDEIHSWTPDLHPEHWPWSDDQNVGRTLWVSTDGSKPNGTTFQYLWQRLDPSNNQVLTSEVGTREIVLKEQDVSFLIRVVVTGTAPDGRTTQKTTRPVDLRVPVCPLRVPSPPDISGRPEVGSVLRVADAVWSKCDSYHYATRYRWLRDRKEVIPGARNKQYRLSAADVGKTISVKAYLPDGTITHTVVSKPTSRIRVVSKPTSPIRTAAIIATESPLLAGVATVGSTLTANRGVWNMPGISFKYRWLRDRKTVIEGATASTYTLTEADRGKTISVKIYASISGYETATAMSPPSRVR